MKIILWLLILFVVIGQCGEKLERIEEVKTDLADARARQEKWTDDLGQLPELRAQLAARKAEVRAARLGKSKDKDGLASLRRVPAPGLSVRCEVDDKLSAPDLPALKAQVQGPSPRVLAWLEAVENSPRHLGIGSADLRAAGKGQLSGTVHVWVVPLP